MTIGVNIYHRADLINKKSGGVTGNASFFDALEAREVRVVGTAVSRSELNCETIRITGEVKLGSLTVNERASMTGTLSVGKIRAEVFELRGKVDCEGNFDCASLEVRGVCNVGALLGAETLTMKARDVSKVKECGEKRHYR